MMGKAEAMRTKRIGTRPCLAAITTQCGVARYKAEWINERG